MRFAVASVFAAGLLVGLGGVSRAEDVQASRVDTREIDKVAAKAIAFLKSKQDSDGAFTPATGPAITALAVAALAQNGLPSSDPTMAKALKFLEKFVQPDGSVCQPESAYRNYETCLAILAFEAANKDGRYKEIIQKADAFVKGQQWGGDKSELTYGGAGYGKKKRPDLSNTAFLIDALKAAGNDAESEAMQRALAFVSRCQNLETEHNATAFSAKVNDGGFYYTPANGGESFAGATDNGGLRSYGSMTYAGLKSMIYAGVGPEDPRVKAAVGWIGKNYDLTQNPGMGDAGLYYYYHTFAKALAALKQDEFTDNAGVKHNWRAELIRELAARQQANGSWVNEKNPRWLEGDANLVTCYALLALSYCR